MAMVFAAGAAAGLFDTHVFLWALAMRKTTDSMGREKTQLVGQSTVLKNRIAGQFACQRKMQRNYPSIAKACTFA
jgi:hypothetical protein